MPFSKSVDPIFTDKVFSISADMDPIPIRYRYLQGWNCIFKSNLSEGFKVFRGDQIL